MSDPAPRLDMRGRPCRVEVVSVSKCSWMAHVHVGNAILRSTRVHFSPDQANAAAERWLAKYLETGSWTEATDWHERNYWHTPEGSGHKPERSSHKGEGAPAIESENDPAIPEASS